MRLCVLPSLPVSRSGRGFLAPRDISSLRSHVLFPFPPPPPVQAGPFVWPFHLMLISLSSGTRDRQSPSLLFAAWLAQIGNQGGGICHVHIERHANPSRKTHTPSHCGFLLLPHLLFALVEGGEKRVWPGAGGRLGRSWSWPWPGSLRHCMSSTLPIRRSSALRRLCLPCSVVAVALYSAHPPCLVGLLKSGEG